MAFKGDLKDINLADIFQTLAMNQQEGTLSIQSGERHTNIYFSKEGVRLLVSPDQKHIRLGELLLKTKKLTPVELDMALARQKMTGELLGQALIDMNVVTAEDINDCVHKQIEEDIYEVFSWKKAAFDFAPGEPKGEFFDPAKMGHPIAFNVNSVIMEAARRIDEWALIHRSIPTTSTIHMIKDPQAAIPDISHVGFSGNDILQIVKAIDGRSTVDDIVNRSPLSKFETCKIMAALIEAMYIQKLDLDETVRIADGLYREGDRDGAIRIYKDTLLEHPKNLRLRLRLAELYETEDMKGEAGAEYAKAAQTYLDSDAEGDGLALYRKAIELAPKNFSIRQKLFNHYSSAQKFGLAATEGLFVAKTYWRMNRLEDARSTLEQIVAMSPDKVEALQMLTSIHLDLDEPDKALEYYEALTEAYRKKGDDEKLAECYRKILVLEPKRGGVRNKLNSLLAKRKKVKRKGGRKLLYALVLLLVLIAAGAAYYIIREIDVSEKLSGLLRETDKVLEEVNSRNISSDADSMDAEQELRGMLGRLKAFKDDNPHSIKVLTGTELDAKIDKLRKRAEQIAKKREADQEDREAQNAKRYRNARELDQADRFEEALKAYSKIDKELLGKSRADFLDSRTKYIRDYLREAQTLSDKAQRYKDAKQWQFTHKALKELLDNYKHSPLAANVELPLLVKSDPPGAEVRIAGVVKGITPYVHMRKPKLLIRVEVTKRGYESPPARTAGDPDWMLAFRLVKVPIWVCRTTGFIESTPVADNGKAYFGTRSGNVYAIDVKSGTVTWEFAAPAGGFRYFLASPMVAAGKVYIGCFDRNLYALDGSRGNVLWSLRFDKHIWTSPSSIDASGAFFIGCSDKKIYAIDSQEKSVLWRSPTGDEVLSSPVHKDNVVYAGSNDGKVYAVDTGSGDLIWDFQTLGPVTARPAFYFDRNANRQLLIVGSSDGAVYALNTLPAPQLPEGEERKVWRFAAAGPVRSSPFVAGNSVYVTSDDNNLYCLDAASGKQKWAYKTLNSSSSNPLVVDGIVYFGSTDSCFYAVSAKDGQLVWKFKTGGQIYGGACLAKVKAAGGPDEEYILVGSTDCKLYCFTKD